MNNSLILAMNCPLRQEETVKPANKIGSCDLRQIQLFIYVIRMRHEI